MILPATRRAVAATRTGRIGVIGTRGHGGVDAPTRTRSPPPRRCTVTAGPAREFVDFVEAGVTGGDELLGVAHEYLDPLRTPTSTP